MKITKIWENYFFKKRYIFSYISQKEIFDNVYYSSMAELDISSLPKVLDLRLSNYLRLRQDSSEWVIFYYQMNQEIYGYSFLHTPTRDVWHDSLPTMNGEARTSATYIYPKHRGKGIRGKIANEQIKYAEERNMKLWSVIEATNKPSLKSSLKIGSSYRVNYLIKFLGRNIFSVLTNPFQIYFLSGNKRARR